LFDCIVLFLKLYFKMSSEIEAEGEDVLLFTGALNGISTLEKEHKKYKSQIQNEMKNITNEYNKLFSSIINNYNTLFASISAEITNLKQNYEQFEKDKNMINNVHFDDEIELNIGGNAYKTSLKTLRKYPESLLGKMFSGTYSVNAGKDGSYFLDHDGRHFYFILNYLRNDDIALLKKSDPLIDELLKEAEFYQLPGLVERLKLQKSKDEEEMKIDVSRQEKEFEEKLKLYQKELENKLSLFQKEYDEKIDILKMDSGILSDNEKLMLLQWIPTDLKKKKLSLLFRASRDGFTAQAFHEKCNTKVPTIVVVHSNNNHVFGGFTPIAWDSSNAYKVENAKTSFLFLLRSQRGDEMSKFALKASSNDNHIYCHQSYGPTFGNADHDIYICDNCNTTNSSYSNFGNTYDHANDQNKLAGGYNFTVKDYEVFVLE